MTEEKIIFGGWSTEKVVTPDVKEICIKVKPEIEKKAKMQFDGYIPLTFMEQIVAGTNYMVKVYVGVNECVHAKIYEASNGAKLDVQNVDSKETASSPLVPF